MAEPKTVVCYGDSNTHGMSGIVPVDFSRLPYASRWTTFLQSQFDQDGTPTRVIPEGLNGRTTCLDDEQCWMCVDGAPGGMNGRKYLLPCLHSHKPVDVVVLSLGCNDLKTRFNLSPSEIANGCKLLLRDIKASTTGPGGASPKFVYFYLLVESSAIIHSHITSNVCRQLL